METPSHLDNHQHGLIEIYGEFPYFTAGESRKCQEVTRTSAAPRDAEFDSNWWLSRPDGMPVRRRAEGALRQILITTTKQKRRAGTPFLSRLEANLAQRSDPFHDCFYLMRKSWTRLQLPFDRVLAAVVLHLFLVSYFHDWLNAMKASCYQMLEYNNFCWTNLRV